MRLPSSLPFPFHVSGSFQFWVIKLLRLLLKWSKEISLPHTVLFLYYAWGGDDASNERKEKKNTWVKPCIRVLSDGWSLKLRVSIIFTITLLKVVAVVVLLSFDCHSSKNDEIWNFFTWNWVRLRKYLLFGRKQIQISSIITGNLITEQ